MLTRAELITIYIMLMVACCIPGMGFTQFMIPCLLGSTYYATPENNWDSLYNQYIPQWMIPRGENVARYFFEGLPEGTSIPWGAWVVPLSLWFSFFLALAFAMICAMVILRKQWVDNEKLSYALVQVPMEMMRQEGRRRCGPLVLHQQGHVAGLRRLLPAVERQRHALLFSGVSPL